MCQKDDVKVVNASWSGMYDPVRHAVARQCKKDYDTLVVNSAGNSNEEVFGDPELDDIIFVGATNSADERASFSNYGALVDVWAPGLDIFTTRDDAVTGSLYGHISGTSFSAPIVAGVIGLIWSTNPDLTADEVEAILKQSCDTLPSLDGLGGYGRVNAFEALKLATGMTTLTPTSAPECNEEIELEYVTDEWPTDNTIFIRTGMETLYGRGAGGDQCHTKFTETLGGLCMDVDYHVALEDSYEDGWYTCGGGGDSNPFCNKSCQPPYLKGTYKGQTLFHLTGFGGSYVEMPFTLTKSSKASKASKATKRSRMRAIR